jgi:hypothetical protein
MIGDAFKPYQGTNNPTMFTAVFSVIGLIVAGWLVRHSGYPVPGTVLVWIPAAPLFAYGLFVLLMIIANPNMK